MKAKDIISKNYEIVATKQFGDKVLNIWKPKTMQPLPQSLVDDFADESLCSDYPVRGLRYGVGNPDWGEFDALVVIGRHGWITELYVCSIIVRPFSEEADKYYSEHWPSEPAKRLAVMWDSRNYDKEHGYEPKNTMEQ